MNEYATIRDRGIWMGEDVIALYISEWLLGWAHDSEGLRPQNLCISSSSHLMNK